MITGGGSFFNLRALCAVFFGDRFGEMEMLTEVNSRCDVELVVSNGINKSNCFAVPRRVDL